MKKLIQPSEIKGIITAPASKSMMQRSIAIAALAEGKSILHNYTSCDDSDAALEIASRLGASVSIEGATVFIEGKTKEIQDSLNCGEAGLGIRMFTPIASLFEKEIVLHGEGSLRKRPIDMLEGPLRELGVQINTTNGFVPISVCGPMRGGEAAVDGSLSSQMLTGLLIALPLATGDTLLSVNNLKSKPYIDMTLDVMKDFGVEVSHTNYQRFSILGNQKYTGREYFVEGDWSGAAFLLVAGAIAGEVEVGNIFSKSKQADVAILQALNDAGAIINEGQDVITVKQGKKLKAFQFDATECPDLFPPLVCLASYCKGTSKIKGVSRLKHKESDRATVLQKEFGKIGIKIIIEDDYLLVKGGEIKGGEIHANNDHRIAMAGAIVALKAQNAVVVDNAQCIAKSYPAFYHDLTALGAQIKDAT